MNSIVPFNRYTNCPVADYKGERYNLPFNMNTFYQMWGVRTPQEAQKKIDEQRREAVEALEGREPANLEEQALLPMSRQAQNVVVKTYCKETYIEQVLNIYSKAIRDE